MKKTILLLTIILLAGQVYAQIPEDLDARVAKLINFPSVSINDRLMGFERIDIFYYEMKLIGNGYNGYIIQIYNDAKKFIGLIDGRLFDDIDVARRYKGAYLTALENNDFRYAHKTEDDESLVYRLPKITVFVSDKYENRQTGIRVLYHFY